MKIWKNLFGTGDKISASEIWYDGEVLTSLLEKLKITNKRANGNVNITLIGNSFYVLLTNIGASNSTSFGIYFIHTFGASYQRLHAINDSGYVDIDLDGRNLSLYRNATYNYCLIEMVTDV